VIIVQKKEEEHTGPALEMGAMIHAAVGAMKTIIVIKDGGAEACIGFRPPLFHGPPAFGFLGPVMK